MIPIAFLINITAPWVWGASWILCRGNKEKKQTRWNWARARERLKTFSKGQSFRYTGFKCTLLLATSSPGVHGFVKKWHFLSSAFFGQISPEKSVLGIQIKNECFLDKEKEVLQKSKTSIFSKEFSPWFLSKKRTFYHLCFLGESSQKRSFFDILDKKECFLDQKNEVLKMFKISKFGKVQFFRLF